MSENRLGMTRDKAYHLMYLIALNEMVIYYYMFCSFMKTGLHALEQLEYYKIVPWVDHVIIQSKPKMISATSIYI